MKSALPLLFILFLSACGNPHLNDSNDPFLASFPVVGNPFDDLVVTNPDGGGYLAITTNKPNLNGTLEIKNPNNKELQTSYAFEKGDHFRWNGGPFPGLNGSCSEAQAAQVQCQLDIEFFASLPGEYSDNLIVTTFLASKPGELRVRKIPLKGKRLAGEILSPVVTSPDGGTVIDVSTSTNTTTIQVSQTNPNDNDLIVSYRFTKGEHFRFNGGAFPGTNGNCSAEQAGSSSCALDIEFFSDVVGRFTDELVVTFALKSNPSNTRVIKVPLIGERLAPPAANISVTGLGNRPSIDFGSQVQGYALRTDSVIVENRGSVPLNISVALSGSLPFASTNKCPAILPAGESCVVETSYASTAVGVHTAAVNVTYSVTGGSAKVSSVPLKGTTVNKPVVPGELSFGNISGAGIDFGSVDAGAETRKLIEVKNIGEGSVQLTTPVIAGESFAFSGGQFPGLRGTCGSIILPGSCAIELAFSPTKKGTFAGSLSLPQTTGKTLTLNLAGTSGSDLPPVCYRIEERVVRARPGANASGIIFPYLATNSGTTASLVTLYGSATNNYIQSLNRYTVKDAQVYVSYDFPGIPSAEELLAVELDLDITKVIQDDYKDTESLCLSTANHRLCSGREFTLASWQKLRNPNFWTPEQAPVNTRYEDDFRKGAAGCGNYTCFNLIKAYSMASLFGLSNSELRNFGGKRIHFIFSDDTRLRSLPTLKIRTKKAIACQ